MKRIMAQEIAADGVSRQSPERFDNGTLWSVDAGLAQSAYFLINYEVIADVVKW
jgi:hypothetical protein